MALRRQGLLRLGVLNIPWTKEYFVFGSTGIDSVEPFDVLGANVGTEVAEVFNLAGNVSASSIEPFYLGTNVLASSVESFYLSDGTTGFIGTNSPAAPRLGWRDR